MAKAAAERRTRTAAPSTAHRIQAAAERLFANEGVDRVTLRQIARASGQGNVAAVQYHFGTKEALLAQIVESHQREIDARRQRMLAVHEEIGEADTLSNLLGMLVEPLAEKLDDPSGRAYLQIQTQRIERGGLYPATRSIAERIAKVLGSSFREPLFNQFAVLLLFQALADRARSETLGSPSPKSRRAFVRALIRALHGLYSGPRID